MLCHLQASLLVHQAYKLVNQRYVILSVCRRLLNVTFQSIQNLNYYCSQTRNGNEEQIIAGWENCVVYNQWWKKY